MTRPDFAHIDRVLAECDARNLPPLELTPATADQATADQGSPSGPEPPIRAHTRPESDLQAMCQALRQSVPLWVITHAEAARMLGYTPAQLGLEEPPARHRIRWPWRRAR